MNNLIEKNLLSALLEFIRNSVSYETASLNDERIKELIGEVIDDEYLKKCDLSDGIDNILKDNNFVTSDEVDDKIDEKIDEKISDYLYDNDYINNNNIDSYIEDYLSYTDLVDKDDVENMIEIKLDEKINELEMKLALIEIESEFLDLKNEMMKGE